MSRTSSYLKTTIVRRILLGAAVLLILSACAAGPNAATDMPAADGNIAGFWTGWWHGFIVPITFIVSLFSDTVNIYEVHNTDAGYDFGFLFGVSSVFGGSGAGAKSRRR